MCCRKMILIVINVLVRCLGKQNPRDILCHTSCGTLRMRGELPAGKTIIQSYQQHGHSTLSSWQHLNDLEFHLEWIEWLLCIHVHCINMLPSVWDYDNMNLLKSFWDPPLGPRIVDLIIFVWLIVTFSTAFLSAVPCWCCVVTGSGYLQHSMKERKKRQLPPAIAGCPWLNEWLEHSLVQVW